MAGGGGGNRWIHAFPKWLFEWSEMQTASSRNETRVVDSISYDDNRNFELASTYMCMCVFVCVMNGRWLTFC